jgi:hypothetical protein
MMTSTRWVGSLGLLAGFGFAACSGSTVQKRAVESPESTCPTVPAPAPDGGAATGFPCEGLRRANTAEPATPACDTPYYPASPADCTAQGAFFHDQTRMCVSACLPPEEQKGEHCCMVGSQGICCPNGVDSDHECLPTPPDGSGSGPSPCPSNRPNLRCTGYHSCKCFP